MSWKHMPGRKNGSMYVNDPAARKYLFTVLHGKGAAAAVPAHPGPVPHMAALFLTVHFTIYTLSFLSASHPDAPNRSRDTAAK